MGGSQQTRPTTPVRGQWTRLTTDPFVLVALILAAFYAAFYSLPLVSSEAMTRLATLFGDACWLVLVVISLLAAIPGTQHPEQRRFWALLGLAFSCWLGSSVLLPLNEGADWGISIAIAEDAFYLLFYLFMLLAATSRPHLRPDWTRDNHLYWIETVGGIVFLALLMNYFVLVPARVNPQAYSSWQPSHLMFVLMDTLLLSLFAYLFFSCRNRLPWRWIYGGLTVASINWLSIDVADFLMHLDVLPMVGFGTLLDLYWFAPYPTVILATRLGLRRMRESPEAPFDPAQPRQHTRSMLLVCILLFVAAHFLAHWLALLDEESRFAREICLTLAVLLVGGISMLHQLLLERELKRAEHRYRILFQEAPVMYLVTRVNGGTRIVEDCNELFLKALGYQLKEVVGRPLADFYTPASRRDMERRQAEVQPPLSEVVERVLVAKDSRRVPALLRVSPITDNAGRQVGTRAAFVDITDQRRLEAQLRHSQKLETIGTLAGGIAHDFNNILMPILSYGEMALERVPKGSPVQEDIRLMLQGAGRAKELVGQILLASRQVEQERTSVDLAGLVGETLLFLRASLPSTIEIRKDFEPDCPPVLADPGEIQQVVMNLVANAFQAMREEGGVVQVKVSSFQADREFLRTRPNLRPIRYVRLSVADTGKGMNRDTLERAFEPFYTTRSVSQGTGLGLSIVHAVITSIGGGIFLQSKPGKGTSADIFLPALEAEPALEAKAASPTAERGAERVLIVDDEEEIARMAAQLLRHFGYQTAAFTDSLKALEKIKGSPQAFDVLITDQTMPSLTGVQLVRELKGIRPDLPVILMTGFSETVTEANCKEFGIDALVLKPLGAKKLHETIREVLDSQH